VNLAFACLNERGAREEQDNQGETQQENKRREYVRADHEISHYAVRVSRAASVHAPIRTVHFFSPSDRM
jgi:hypothetical protein